MSLTIHAEFSPRHEVAPPSVVDAADPGGYLRCKNLADRLAASLLLVLLTPLILALAAVVRLTSRGPAIYRQVRLGRDGRPFQILKLRSMRHDCERLTGPLWASKAGDSRVTPVGDFLRLSHLDELPQLWNVIRGEMSLVGPRPERPEFVAQLRREIPGYDDRMRVRPGITGLAQVRLPADERVDDVRRKVRYDLLYIDSLGAMLDLKILVGTVFKVAGVPFQRTGQILDLPLAPGPEPEGLAPAVEPPLTRQA